MKTKLLLKAGVFCVGMIGCLDLTGVQVPGLGLSSAEARDYYTRKRINGKWVTGVFPKKETVVEPAAAEPAVVSAPPSPPRPTLLGLNIPGVDLAYRPSIREQMAEAEAAQQAVQQENERRLTASTQTATYTGTGSARRTTSSRLLEGTPGVQDEPGYEPKHNRKPTKVAAKRSGTKAESVAHSKSRNSTAEARMRADTEFAAAVAQPVQVNTPAVPAAVQAYAPLPQANDLFTALQRKARAMADEEAIRTTGSIGGEQPSRNAEASPVAARGHILAAGKPIRSMTFNYDTGVKTTFFLDGTIEEERIADHGEGTR